MYFPESAAVFPASAHPWEIIAARRRGGPVVVLPRHSGVADLGECSWTWRTDNMFQSGAKA